MEHVVIHYSEIGLKKGNRAFFEGMLVENVKRALGKSVISVNRETGKLVARVKPESRINCLSKVPGIANYSPAIRTVTDLKSIKEKALALALKDKSKTFRVSAVRNWKEFSLASQQVNERVGSFVQENTGKKVRLKKPGLTLFVEIGSKHSYVYKQKIEGIGGVPVGSAGRVLSLISGGIDSPVASYLMMKRGARVVFVHFANNTYATRASTNKVKELVKKLDAYQKNSRLYIIPFEEFQKQIVINAKPRYRMLVYRRAMLRIAEEIMKKERCKAMVTGDSLSQVASQTLENINAVRAVTAKVILSPLIGLNKQEIISLAKKIGTYEASIKPYPDCCSYLIGKHPETKGNAKELDKIEKEIPIKELVKKSVEKAELVKY